MQANVLIIEDEPKIAELIAMYLQKEGIRTVMKGSGEDGLHAVRTENFDLVLLDINLPGLDGFEVLQEIRKTAELPVIIVSARQEDEDMIMGFGIGADDYVTKPFSPKVLAARVRSHLKRKNSPDFSDTNIVEFGPYKFDAENLILKKNGTRIELPPKEMGLLAVMAENPGKACSQELLYSLIWNNAYGDLTTVSVHIQRLRKKLEQDPSVPVYIRTSYGFGYYLNLHGNSE